MDTTRPTDWNEPPICGSYSFKFRHHRLGQELLPTLKFFAVVRIFSAFGGPDNAPHVVLAAIYATETTAALLQIVMAFAFDDVSTAFATDFVRYNNSHLSVSQFTDVHPSIYFCNISFSFFSVHPMHRICCDLTFLSE